MTGARRCCTNRFGRGLNLRPSNLYPDDRAGLRLAQRGHPVQCVAPDHRLPPLRFAVPCPKAVSERALIPQEEILDAGLSAIPRLPLPALSPDFANRLKGHIPLRPRALAAARCHRRSSRWDHDLNVRCADLAEQLVHRPGIVVPIGREAPDRRVDLFEESRDGGRDRPRCSS